MISPFKYVQFAVAVLLMAPLVNASDDATEKPTTQACLRLNQVIDAHKTNFDSLKKDHIHSGRMDIWSTDHHLAGDSCQIWGWANGRKAYVCSLTTPSNDIAKLKQENAIVTADQCLGKQWTMTAKNNEQEGYTRRYFQEEDSSVVVSIHRVNTQGFFKQEWTLYYFVGDPDQLQ